MEWSEMEWSGMEGEEGKGMVIFLSYVMYKNK